MANTNPIELDVFYNRLSTLIESTDLNPVERILFLAAFESWYSFQTYEIYSSIASKAIETFEVNANA
ncbi:hypothetical protein HJ019_23855 [Vibrio parahaemolyticus]|nr:hypothetical protein [Vibrio parahaemolyticus]MBE4431664.1 hypothetical protein [Vibrio parahaemolyticus]